MRLPLTPPTDNLYKFMAIAGIAVMVLAVLGPAFAIALGERHQERVDDVLVDLARLEAQERVLEVKYAHVEEWYDGESSLTIARSDPRLQEIVSSNDEAYQLYVERAALEECVSREADRREFCESIFLQSVVEQWVLLVFGAVLAVAGFTLWYRRLQRYQDRDARGPVPIARLVHPGHPDWPDRLRL